jgi:hypothetical protein
MPRTQDGAPGTQNAGPAERPLLVILRHKQGHSLPAMLRRTPLRDALGKRFGTLLRFHPVEEIDTLPHGAVDEDGAGRIAWKPRRRIWKSGWTRPGRSGTPMPCPLGCCGSVDQAAMLRKTHGRDACDAMLGLWSGRCCTGSSRRRFWAAGGRTSFWCCAMSARRRCWRRMRIDWAGWRGRRIFAGGATA